MDRKRRSFKMAKLRKLVYSIASFAIVLGSLMAFSAPTAALAAPAYDYQLISQSAYPATLAPGATTNVYIEVKNTGTATWGSNVRLGSGSSYGAANQQRDYSSEFANSDWLSANRPAGMSNGGAVTNIIPGWVVRFQFNIKAPTVNGTYKAYFTPVADGVTWMKDIGIYWQITVAGGTNNPNNPVITPGASMSVALSSDSPAANAIPDNANGVTYAKFAFTGGSSNSTISNLTVKRVSAGSANDFNAVYLYDGDTRLTTARNVNGSTNEVTFTGLSVSVPAGGVKVLSIVVDLGGIPATSDAFEIESASKIVGATFSGNYPIVGASMTTTLAQVGTVAIARNSAMTNPKIGDQGVEVAEFKVTAGTEDITLRRIALTNYGGVNSTNITGLSLKLNGAEVATSSGFVRDTATFVLNTPMVILNGSNKIFQLYANVTGRPNETIQIAVDDNADVYATGNTYGYGENINRGNYDNHGGGFPNAFASCSTLQGGTITVTSSTPAAADIAANQNDVPFLNFAITSGVNAEVRTLTINVRSNDLISAVPDSHYRDIKIKEGDVTILGPKELITAGPGFNDAVQALVFTERFTISAGQTRNLTVTMDTANEPADIVNDTVRVELVAFGAADIKSLDTNDYINDIVPSTDIVGKTMTVKTSGLTVDIASTPVSQTVVINKTNVDTAGFLFSALSTSAVTINSVKFTGYIDDAVAGGGNPATYDDFVVGGVGNTDGTVLRDVVSSISLYNATTGQVVAGPKSLALDGTIVFTGLSINVPASGTVKLIPRVNISASDPECAFAFDIGNVGGVLDITAQDASNNIDVTATLAPNGAAAPNTFVTVAAAGTLNAIVSAATPATTIAQAGATNIQTTKIKFSAIGEAFTISELGIALTNGATDVDSVVLTSGSTSVTGSPSGGALRFTGLAIAVPKDGNVEVTLAANLNTISAGALSGDVFKVAIDKNDIKATGIDSGVIKLATDNGVALAGNNMVIRKTKPVISTTGTSGTLAGTINVYNMSVAAGSGDDASFKQLTLDLSLTGAANAVKNIAVYQDGTKVPDADIALTDDDGAITPSTTAGNQIEVGDTFLVISWKTTKELTVGMGQSSTIIVKGSAVTAATGTFTASLADENTTTVETGIVADVGAGNLEIGAGGLRSIIWSDNSSNIHDAALPSTSTDWSNGYPLKEIPGAVISYSISI